MQITNVMLKTIDLLLPLSTYSAIRMIAQNDANKKLLVELGALELLVKLGRTGNEEEQLGKNVFFDNH